MAQRYSKSDKSYEHSENELRKTPSPLRNIQYRRWCEMRTNDNGVSSLYKRQDQFAPTIVYRRHAFDAQPPSNLRVTMQRETSGRQRDRYNVIRFPENSGGEQGRTREDSGSHLFDRSRYCTTNGARNWEPLRGREKTLFERDAQVLGPEHHLGKRTAPPAMSGVYRQGSPSHNRRFQNFAMGSRCNTEGLVATDLSKVRKRRAEELREENSPVDIDWRDRRRRRDFDFDSVAGHHRKRPRMSEQRPNDEHYFKDVTPAGSRAEEEAQKSRRAGAKLSCRPWESSWEVHMRKDQTKTKRYSEEDHAENCLADHERRHSVLVPGHSRKRPWKSERQRVSRNVTPDSESEEELQAPKQSGGGVSKSYGGSGGGVHMRKDRNETKRGSLEEKDPAKNYPVDHGHQRKRSKDVTPDSESEEELQAPKQTGGRGSKSSSSSESSRRSSSVSSSRSRSCSSDSSCSSSGSANVKETDVDCLDAVKKVPAKPKRARVATSLLKEDTTSPELQSRNESSKAKCAEAVSAASNSSTADTEMTHAEAGSTETDPVSGTEVQSADDVHKSLLLSRAEEVLKSSAEPENDPAGRQDSVTASEITAAVASISNATPEPPSTGRTTLEPCGEESLSVPQGGVRGHQDSVAASEITAAVASISNATPEPPSTGRTTLEPCGEESLSVPQGGVRGHQDSVAASEITAAVAAITNATPEPPSTGRTTLEPCGEESFSVPQGGVRGHQDSVAASEITAAVASISNATPEPPSTGRTTLEPCGEESFSVPQGGVRGHQDSVAASEITAAVAAITNATPEPPSTGRTTLEPCGEESFSVPQGGVRGHQDSVAASEITAAVAAITNATPEPPSTGRTTLQPCGEESLSVPPGGAPGHQDLLADHAALAAIKNSETALQSLLDGKIRTSFQDCHIMGLFAEEQEPATTEYHSFPRQPQPEDALHTPQILPVESLTLCSSHIQGNDPLASLHQALVSRQPSAPQNHHPEHGDGQMYNPPPVTVEQPAYPTVLQHQAPLAQAYPGLEGPYAHVSQQASAPQNQHLEHGNAQIYNPPPVSVEQPAYPTAWQHQTPLTQVYPGLEVPYADVSRQPSAPQNQHPGHGDGQMNNPPPVAVEQPTLQPAPYLANHQRGTGSLLTMVKQSILCSVCKTIFNRAVICREYLIELNRPVQCVCGCVICTLCYREQGGCRMHNVSSKQGPICTLVNALASCPELEGLGDWDVKLNLDDHYKTDDQVNKHVQQIMEQDHPALHTAFRHLIDRNDSMSFKYWESETLPEEMAYRYVCIPHITGFWDHVLVGNRPPSKTETMIGPDEHLPKLFNVRLGSIRFHWCCFVLQEQVILAMWCTLVPERGLPKVLPLVDTTLKPITSSKEFRNMVFFLARWFTVQYASQKERQLKVVLDCKPSEGSTLVHIIALLAYRSGMENVNPQVAQQRARNNVNYHFNLSHANDMFKCPYVQNLEGCYLNIVDEFNSFNDHQANGVTQIYTENFI